MDPLEQVKLDKMAKILAAANSFEVVAEEWLDKIKREGIAPMTFKRAR